MKHTTFAIVAVLLCTSGCEQVKRIDTQGDTGGECLVPDQVQAIFDQSCGIGGCHGMGSAQQNLSLEAGQSEGIIGRSSTQNPELPLVELGSVSGSYLAVKIQPDLGMLVGDPMPLEPGELSETDKAVLLGWIAGAQLPCAGGTGSGTGGSDTGMPDTGATTGPNLQACGIQDLKAGAPNPIDAGMGVGQIPPDIGEVLANNCGCHYADDLDVTTVADYSSALPLHIDTLEGFNEMLPTDQVAYMRVLERVTSETLPMPPVQCQLEGGVSITQADKELLVSWLEADVPDGATWMP